MIRERAGPVSAERAGAGIDAERKMKTRIIEVGEILSLLSARGVEKQLMRLRGSILCLRADGVNFIQLTPPSV